MVCMTERSDVGRKRSEHTVSQHAKGYPCEPTHETIRVSSCLSLSVAPREPFLRSHFFNVKFVD